LWLTPLLNPIIIFISPLWEVTEMRCASGQRAYTQNESIMCIMKHSIDSFQTAPDQKWNWGCNGLKEIVVVIRNTQQAYNTRSGAARTEFFLPHDNVKCVIRLCATLCFIFACQSVVSRGPRVSRWLLIEYACYVVWPAFQF
jgi:hypothetical protein